MRPFSCVPALIVLLLTAGLGRAQQPVTPDTRSLDFKEFGLLAIQDNGRRKPIDTFARQTLIQLTGRSSYTDKAGRRWTPNDFLLSAVLETRDWKDEPMVLVSFGELKEQLGLEKTQRRFSFAQLSEAATLPQIANEAHERKRAEKPLDRLQQEALSVNDRLVLFARVIDGSALLIVPSPRKETDPWAPPAPSAIASYYNESQFAPAGVSLQEMMTSYSEANSFKFSRSAHLLREKFRALSPSIYLLASLPATLVALLLVHQMPIAMPASIDPLVPVLRDNFWLTIHVLTITLSYAAFLLACAFGHILLFRYARNPRGARADAPMHFWLYRVLQLGVLLLAAGTILGGVWANYSWGRFWGWDPKETWALIALLCYLTTLHGRLAGWWTEFGLVVASVVCFLAVLMAWYGVNFVLGKGLHSYGFGIGGETYVAIGVVLDLLFVAFAIWRYRSSKRTPSSTPVEAVAV